MHIQRIRDRLLLAAVSIGLITTMAYMVSVSLVLRQQYFDRAQLVLGKAAELISDELTQRRSTLQNAALQMAALRNLGSTIWYLGQYTQSSLDRETLASTFLQLAREARKTRSGSAATAVTVYDISGRALVFAHRLGPTEQVGYLDAASNPQYQLALVNGDDIHEGDLQAVPTVAALAPAWIAPLNRESSVRYAVRDERLVMEAIAPVMNEVLDSDNTRHVQRQVGLIVVTQVLDTDFVKRIARHTDTEVNIFTQRALSVGTLPAYTSPPALSGPLGAASVGASPSEVQVGTVRYYQGQTHLVADGQAIGNVVTLYSQDEVNQAIARMNLALAAMAFLCLACMVPLAWLLATSLARPLSALTRVFHAQAGNLADAATPRDWAYVHSYAQKAGELGDLSRAFLAMRQAVLGKMEQINELNASLEGQVEQRTQALQQKELEARSLLENSPDSIVRYDQDGTRVYVNPAFLRTMGHDAQALLGRRATAVDDREHVADHNPIYQERLQGVLRDGRDAQFEFRWQDPDGPVRCFHVRMIAEFDPERHAHGALAIWRDISDRLAYEATIWKQANYDALTLLPNRRLFNDRLEHETLMAQRTGHSLVLMLLDLDHFKEVNDSLGHDHGDMLLVQAAQRIAACMRSSDTLARLGGDEFAAVLPDVDGIDAAQRVAQSMVTALAEPFQLGAHSASVSVSIGLTVFPADADDLVELIKNADLAMYAAKSAGRNTYQYYTPALRRKD